MNKVILMGRLGNEPEIRYTPNGDAVANFSMATSEKYKDKNGQQQEKTEWHYCSVFGKRAEVIGEYFSKGSQILVEGKIQTNKWTNQEGKEVEKKYISITSFNFISSSGSNNQTNNNSNHKKSNPKNDEPEFYDDDIPF